MTDTIRFVNTASAGGDGTGGIDVIAGGTAAYSSMASAEAAEQTTVNVSDRFIFECKGVAADTGFTISGWTVNGEIIVRSHTSSRHAGVYDTGKYRVEDTTNVITLADNNTTLEYIQVADTSPGSRFCVIFSGGSGGSKLLRSVLKDDTAGAGDTAISFASSNAEFQIAHNIFYGFPDIIFDNSTDGAIATVFNNTFVDCDSIYTVTKTNLPLFKNNIIQNSTNGITGTVDSGSDFNATDSANFGSGYTTNTNDRVSQTFTFVNAGANDYHITPGDTGVKDHGTDLSGVTDSIDIDGDAIAGTWSIGADFIVSVVGVTIPVIMHSYKQRRV